MATVTPYGPVPPIKEVQPKVPGVDLSINTADGTDPYVDEGLAQTLLKQRLKSARSGYEMPDKPTHWAQGLAHVFSKWQQGQEERKIYKDAKVLTRSVAKRKKAEAEAAAAAEQAKIDRAEKWKQRQADQQDEQNQIRREAIAAREKASAERVAAADARLNKSLAAQERMAAEREKQAAMREERKNRKETFKMDRELALKTGGVDASDTTKKAMAKLKTTMDEIGATATELSPTMIDPTKSIVLSISESVPIISGAMADALYNERDTKTKARVTGLVNNIRNALFGAAQSKGELFNFKPMDPLQPGIGLSTAKARMEALLNRFKSEYGNMKKVFPAVAYTLGDKDVPQGAWMKYMPQTSQQQQMAPPPQQQQMAPPPPPNTVDIGGVKYEVDPQTGDVYMVP